MKVFAITLALMLTSCAYLKPAADALLVVSQFPQCRAELQRYLPDDVEADLVIPWENVDSTFNKVISAAAGDMEMTLQTAFDIANVPVTADLIELDFMDIVNTTLDYKRSSGIEPSQVLKDCNKSTQAGWKAVRDNEQVATVGDFLRAAAPYAKLIPLLLERNRAGVYS